MRCSMLCDALALPLCLLLAVRGSAEVMEVQPHGMVQEQKPPRQLVRSEVPGIPSFAEMDSEDAELLRPPLDSSLNYVENGVPLGSCKNFRLDEEQSASVKCPKGLKMVGCSCRDFLGQKTGACATEFSHPETCNAYTKLGRRVTAYVRCCHMDWASNFSIRTSAKTGPKDGDGESIGCPLGEQLLGCACVPVDKPNRGCKHTLIEGTDTAPKCTATNLNEHPAGVKAQALCAVLPNSTAWETVKLAEHAVDRSSNLSCSQPYPTLQMVSCSCGSNVGQCNGGKVIAHRCECNGARCYASARCANIPIPPQDCIWQDWGAFSDCSVSCNTQATDGSEVGGVKTRVREIALVATNGGQPCQGNTSMETPCLGDASEEECSPKKAIILTEENKNTVYMLIGVVAVLTCGAGGGVLHYMERKRQAEKEELMGGEDDGGMRTSQSQAPGQSEQQEGGEW